MMQDFAQNSCRLCRKTFCCVDCRCKHEKTFHNINPNCDICIYGRVILHNPTSSLLNHIRLSHWPLHCVNCHKEYSTLDEMVLHEKCPVMSKPQDAVKFPGTPITPINEISNESNSLSVTPFYKNIITGTEHIGLTMGITSTPMHHENIRLLEKRTPTSDSSEIKLIFKSSLKLTRSGTPNDSKKSDRRVTFSETPLLESSRKLLRPIPQILCHREPLMELNHFTNTSDMDDLYKTSNDDCKFADENKYSDNRIVPYTPPFVDATIWETAVTSLSITKSGLDNIDYFQECKSQFPSSLNARDSLKSVSENAQVSIFLPEDNLEGNISTLWSSVANLMKNVVHTLSFGSQTSFSMKRPRSNNDFKVDNDEDERSRYKKMKLTDIRCRRPLRHPRPLEQIRSFKKHFVDKATQTEDIFL